MTDEPRKVYGMAWYDEGDWDRLLEVSEDSEELEDTWREWREHALESLNELTEQGVDVRKVPVDPDQLQAWCIIKGKSVDSDARAEYAAEQLRKNDQENGDE